MVACAMSMTADRDDVQATHAICTGHTCLELVCHHVFNRTDSLSMADQTDRNVQRFSASCIQLLWLRVML